MTFGSIRHGVNAFSRRRAEKNCFKISSAVFVSGESAMRKAIPASMFAGKDAARLSVLQNWVLENAVTEIEMNERQFWNFVSVQPIAEKPWTTYMGRLLHVSDMPLDSQKCLGLFDKRTPGNI
jgi:hypothetical protein